MTATGVVREWDDDEGYGVIDSAATPGGCWAHFSSVLVQGFRAVEPGRTVSFDFEAVRQDGYDYRAVAVWTGGERPEPTPTDAGGAYRSTLRLEFD